MPHAGICAGGRPKGRSLPEPEPSIAPSCASLPGASTTTSFDGPCRSSNDSGEVPPRRGRGWKRCVSTFLHSSLIGSFSDPPEVGLWEPDDGRLSDAPG